MDKQTETKPAADGSAVLLAERVKPLREWDNWTDAELDALKAGFKAAGCPEVSVHLLTHPKLPRAQCPPCGIWFAIEEIEKAQGCPKCGQCGDFEVPDHYVEISANEALSNGGPEQ